MLATLSTVPALPNAFGKSSYFFDNTRWQGTLTTVIAAPGPQNFDVSHAGVHTEAIVDRLIDPVPAFSLDTSSTSVAPITPTLPLEAYKARPPFTAKRLLRVYSQLSKARLTTLMVLSAMSSFAVSPLPATVPVLLSTAIGTYLCSASANTLNQIAEVPFDAQMARTRNRPLVRGLLSPAHAMGFAVVAGAVGTGILGLCVNGTTAALGALNIWLYAGVYTPMKRVSVVNTWVGAVVGAIPPLMGWTACGGHLIPSSSHPIQIFLPSFLSDAVSSSPTLDNPLAAFALFMLLFSWQFPHFNPLSHVVRSSYAQAGYRMLCVTSPRHNALVGLRHACLLIPICSILVPMSGLTSWWFALTSLVPNLLCTRAAWKWRAVLFSGSPSDKEARLAFGMSLWYLPVVLGLMMLHKRDSWWSRWLEGKEGSEESTSPEVI